MIPTVSNPPDVAALREPATDICTGLTYRYSLGAPSSPEPDPPFDLNTNDAFTLNSPVGLCYDHNQRLWIADTGNNRLIILDRAKKRVMRVVGEAGCAAGQFNMPFRLLAHPDKPWIYVSDLANRRIQVLAYQSNLQIKVLHVFGDQGDALQRLHGPNGLAWVNGTLCVADEFFENSIGGGRVAKFSETGAFLGDIQHIQGAANPDLLWPQGLASDSAGRLYIANTGFYSVVRCDLQGRAVPFHVTGSAELDGLDLSRGVSVINDTLYVPGGAANQIKRFDLDGRELGALGPFFTPIEVAGSRNRQGRAFITVADPVLASVGDYQETSVPGLAVPRQTIGQARNQPGQLYFSTSALHEPIVPADSSTAKAHWPTIPFGEMDPVAWAQWGSQWWMQTMREMWRWWLPNVGLTDAGLQDDETWVLDAANRQIKKTLNAAGQSSDGPDPLTNESWFSLLPGALGIDAYHPRVPVPGQWLPGSALFMVTNYLSGTVSILQYHPLMDELVHLNFFGGLGQAPWQLNKPQGIVVNDRTGDIFIADTGNHRIAHWRVNKNGIVGFVRVIGCCGSKPGEFVSPSDVSLDAMGRLYVADQMNNRIQVFSDSGDFLYAFGKPGYGAEGDRFLLPTSLHIANERLYVNDLVNRSVKVFSLAGAFLGAFSALGAAPETGQLWMPYLIHAHGDHVYVPDCATNRVNVYECRLVESCLQPERDDSDGKCYSPGPVLDKAFRQIRERAIGVAEPDSASAAEVQSLFEQVCTADMKAGKKAMQKLKELHEQLFRQQPPPLF